MVNVQCKQESWMWPYGAVSRNSRYYPDLASGSLHRKHIVSHLSFIPLDTDKVSTTSCLEVGLVSLEVRGVGQIM